MVKLALIAVLIVLSAPLLRADCPLINPLTLPDYTSKGYTTDFSCAAYPEIRCPTDPVPAGSQMGCTRNVCKIYQVPPDQQLACDESKCNLVVVPPEKVVVCSHRKMKFSCEYFADGTKIFDGFITQYSCSGTSCPKIDDPAKEEVACTSSNCAVYQKSPGTQIGCTDDECKPYTNIKGLRLACPKRDLNIGVANSVPADSNREPASN